MKRRMAVLVLLSVAAGLNGPSHGDTVTDFGQASNAWNPQVSPNGDMLAMGCSPSGRETVCIYPLDGDAPILFDLGEDYSVGHFYWASDTHLIAEVSFVEALNTNAGRREYRFSRALSYNVETGRPAILLRSMRNYTDITAVASTCMGKPGVVAMELTVRANDRPEVGSRLGATNRGFSNTLFEVDLDDGSSRQVDSDAVSSVLGNIVDANCDVMGRVLFDDRRERFSVELTQGRRTIFSREGVVRPPLSVLGLNADRDAFIVRLDEGGAIGLHELAMSDGALTPVMHEGRPIGNPNLINDLGGERVVGYSFTNDLREQIFTEPFLAEVHAAMQGVFPGEVVNLVSWSKDHDVFAVSIRRPGHPAAYYLFTVEDGSVAPLSGEADNLADATLSVPMAVRYAARDGLQIPAYLSLPPGKTKADGPFPVVILPHGGPEARTTASYDWLTQALAREGYAVLAPNFRGSYGFGAAFRNAGHGEFGGAMITDMIDGARYLQAEGVGGPEGACILGGSYGGYGALMAPLLDPETIRCSVAINPVTDIFSHMGAYGGSTFGYNYWAQYVGQDTFTRPEDRDPVTPADRTGEYRGPVLILHGKEDKVVDITQSRIFARNWGQRDGLRFVEMDGEGHHLGTDSVRQLVLTEALAFLAENHPSR